MFSTQEVLKIAKTAELETAQKKAKKGTKKRGKATKVEDSKEEQIEIVSSDCDSDCIVVAAKRSS